MTLNRSCRNFKSGCREIKEVSFNRKKNKTSGFVSSGGLAFLCLLIGLLFVSPARAQQFAQNQQYQTNFAKSSVFRQEIARMEITVHRQGEAPLSLTQVPRVQQGDVLKVRMLDEPVGGVKPDQSFWDWTMLIAYVNPNRNKNKEEAVTEEIEFRKKGWYKEHSFTVPYDSQPVIFLYPKPKYRGKIQKLISKKYEEVRKLGEKTIEIAGAYAQIGMFLNQLQQVINRNQYGYGSYGYGYGNSANSFLQQQAVEGLAKSFNIELPACWRGGYGGSYGSGYNNVYTNDFVGRVQCIAQNVRLEDFDLSLGRMLQQGGIVIAAQLSQKYPQLAHWINIAAVAVDFIIKLTKKTPLRIVPTIVAASDAQVNGAYQNNYSNNYSSSYNPSNPVQQNQPVKISLFAESQPDDSQFVTAFPVVIHKWQSEADPEVISLSPPALLEPCLHAGQNILKNTDLSNDQLNDAFTRDYTLVMSSQNGFRKEFQLRKNVGLGGWELNITREDLNAFPKINMTLESVITGTRGFNEIKSPKFDLPIAAGGSWEIKPESQKEFAVGGKRRVTLKNSFGSCRCLQAVIYKPSFGGQFVFEANSNPNGSGYNNQPTGLQFSDDGREVSFEVDATNFQPGQGQLELRQYGGEVVNLNLKLYPAPPQITEFKMRKGDTFAIIKGERLEQLQYVRINGKKAVIQGNNPQGNNLNDIPVNPNEKVAVFENPNDKEISNTVSLELGLEDDRTSSYGQKFAVGQARPTIAANEVKEIEGVFLNGQNKTKPQFDLSSYPVVSVDVSEMSVQVQNKLTDYDFQTGNIQIETRIEKNQVNNINDLPKAAFEVLDGNNLSINFTFTEESRKFLGGKRLQFRIKDRERGDSDWYTIKQTFVRIPQITAVKCSKEMNDQCQLIGQGVDYIQQVSVDGGQTWFPNEPNGLVAQPTVDGQKAALIPLLINRNLLQIRLRDFTKTEKLAITGYVFTNRSGVSTKSIPEVSRSLSSERTLQTKIPRTEPFNPAPNNIKPSTRDKSY